MARLSIPGTPKPWRQIDRREERSKILADLDQKRRHVSAFYLDERRIKHKQSSGDHFTAPTLQRFTCHAVVLTKAERFLVTP
jgi:hypothetical protein